ncbi:MAG TPA: nuclear transport factor 2 family protein [Thermoplasmata archaeon]|nr:nuclear transport factor 2 family protein [Thermoplasmata archaeon]
MTAAKGVVEKFQAAMANDDWKAARGLLKDNLEFHGPLDTFHKAEDYLAALQKLNPMVTGVDIKRVFAEGDDVVVLCDLHFKPPMPPTMYVVEWYGVTRDKISRIQVVFDPSSMPGPPPK